MIHRAKAQRLSRQASLKNPSLEGVRTKPRPGPRPKALTDAAVRTQDQFVFRDLDSPRAGCTQPLLTALEKRIEGAAQFDRTNQRALVLRDEVVMGPLSYLSHPEIRADVERALVTLVTRNRDFRLLDFEVKPNGLDSATISGTVYW